jgi:hypothetical protein
MNILFILIDLMCVACQSNALIRNDINIINKISCAKQLIDIE